MNYNKVLKSIERTQKLAEKFIKMWADSTISNLIQSLYESKSEWDFLNCDVEGQIHPFLIAVTIQNKEKHEFSVWLELDMKKSCLRITKSEYLDEEGEISFFRCADAAFDMERKIFKSSKKAIQDMEMTEEMRLKMVSRVKILRILAEDEKCPVAKMNYKDQIDAFLRSWREPKSVSNYKGEK